MESSSKMLSNIYPGLENVILGILEVWLLATISSLHGYRHREKYFCFLVQERRVIFIVILLGILFYVDNIVLGWSAAGIAYPLGILCLYFIRYDRHVFSS